jgi:Tfp pilus assembly protein FimT
MPPRLLPRDRRLHSFTIVELLVVITIMAIMAAVSVSGFRYLSERDLDNAATIIAGLVDQGRSEAISRGTVVEVCLATGTAAPNTAPYRALSLWAYDSSSGTFTQISPWSYLPNSVQVASVTDPYTTYGLTNTTDAGVHITNTATLSNTTSVMLKGQSVTADYFQFLPSGGAAPPPNVTSTNLDIFVLKASAVNLAPPLKDWRIVQISTLAGQSAILSQ